MTYVITIGGNAVDFADGTLNIEDRINERSVCSFTVIDETGTAEYEQDQKVIVQKDAKNVFAGYVETIGKLALRPTPKISNAFRCRDMVYKAEKRRVMASYANMYAGDIVADLCQKVLADEGVNAQIAYRRDANATQWAQGTLSGVAANSTIDDGALVLIPSGTDFVDTESTTAAFAQGTLSNLEAESNTLQLTSATAIKMQTSCTGGETNPCIYWRIWSGSYIIVSGDTLTYDVWLDGANPEDKGGIDATCSDGTTFRDYNNKALVDQNGIPSHPDSRIGSYATGQWYSRTIDLTAIAGKTMNTASIVQEGDTTGDYMIYTKNVYIKNGASIVCTIFAGTFNMSQWGSGRAYDIEHTSIVGKNVYAGTGYRTSPNKSLTSVGSANSGYLSYIVATPEHTSIIASVSIDGGNTWAETANNTYIASILPQLNVSGKNLNTKFWFYTSDPEVTPILSAVTVTVHTGLSETNTDISQSYGSQTDFDNYGTKTDVTSYADGTLGLSGNWRNWNDGSIANQTLYGATSPAQASSTSYKYFKLTSGTGTDAKSLLGSVAGIADFTMKVDIQVMTGSWNAGFAFRTTYWGNANNTFAYAVNLDATMVQLGHGTNSATNLWTNIQTVSVASSVGSWVTLKVVVAGNSIKVYVDDVLKIDQIDSTFPGAGQVALRIYNGSGTTQTACFDNFAIVNNPVGFWTSNAVAISAVGTVQSSYIQWNNAYLPSGASISISTSLDGGLTWDACTNGGIVPGLVHGYNASGKTIKVLMTINAASISSQPLFDGVSWIVTGDFSASGNRITPSLDLSPVVRAGYSSVSWTEYKPINTTITVQTSIDGGSSWQTCTNGSTIPNITLQPDPYVDFFEADNSSQFSLTGSWVWDVNAHTVISTGAGKAAYSTFTGYENGYTEVDVKGVYQGGPVLMYTDSNNYYKCEARGASHTSAPNTIAVYKVSGGVPTQLGSTVNVGLDNEHVHRIRFQKDGTALTVTVDGISVWSATDATPLTLGSTGGLATQDGTNVFTSLRIQPLGKLLSGMSLLCKQTLSTTSPGYEPRITDLTISMRSNHIQSGVLVPEAKFIYCKASEALDKLAEQCGYWFNIDADSMAWFKEPENIPAPFTVHKDNIQLEGTEVNEGSPDFRNKQFVVGGRDTTDVQTYDFKGDFSSRTFTLPYPLAKAPTLTLNGETVTKGIRGLDTGKQLYWSEDDPVLSQDDTMPTLTDDDVLHVVYYGFFDVVVVVEDTASVEEIKAREGDGTGFVEEVETATELTTRTGAYQLANAKLQRYTPIGKGLKFKTRTYGLAPGQLLTVDLPELQQPRQQFLVESVGTEDVGGLIFYHIEAKRGALSGSWAKFFGKLAEPQKVLDKITVGVGEQLIVTTSYNEQVTWTEEVVVTVTPIPAPSPTLYPSSTLYPG